MLTLRKRIALIIGSVLLVVFIILLWIFLRKKPVIQPTQTQPTEQNPVELPPIENVEFKKPENMPTEETQTPANPDETYAKQTAKIFVERFWSYSNQNDNRHIEDALALSVDSMRTWITSQAKEQGIQYSGVTTEVLSTHTLSYTPTKTSVEVGARQTTRSTGADGKVVEETKDITAKVDLVKVGTNWMVEGIWKE